MFNKSKPVAQRSNVTVDDRRVVLVAAKSRKAAEVAKVPHEVFIRQALKAQLGWPQREPAPKALLDAAKQMAAALTPKHDAAEDGRRAKAKYEAKLALDSWKAKHEPAQA